MEFSEHFSCSPWAKSSVVISSVAVIMGLHNSSWKSADTNGACSPCLELRSILPLPDGKETFCTSWCCFAQPGLSVIATFVPLVTECAKCSSWDELLYHPHGMGQRSHPLLANASSLGSCSLHPDAESSVYYSFHNSLGERGLPEHNSEPPQELPRGEKNPFPSLAVVGCR